MVQAEANDTTCHYQELDRKQFSTIGPDVISKWLEHFFLVAGNCLWLEEFAMILFSIDDWMK